MPYSSGGRPATAFSPMLGISRPSYAQTSLPSSFLTTRGATSTYFAGRRPSNMCGGSTAWSSTLTRIMSSSRTRSPLSAADADVRIPGTRIAKGRA